MRERPGVRGLVACLACLAAAWGGASVAQGTIAYTVQVAALSGAEAAIEQSGALLREGFPAYVVRAEGAAGTVFRIRVGAFGDRRSADRYAQAMGDRAGGTPRPALAEAIPAGILPLAPTAVMRLTNDARAVLLSWAEDGLAVRVGPREGEARYHLLGTRASFLAWWAEPTEDGRLEVARVPLDGEADVDDPDEVRDALFRQRLRLIAERADMAFDALREAVRGASGERHLIAYRAVGGETVERGVLAPDASASSRDAAAWIGEAPPAPPAPLEVLVERAATQPASEDEVAEEPSADPHPADDAPADDVPDGPPTPDGPGGPGADGVTGDGWYAEADGPWTMIETRGTSWRALVGTPKAGLRDLLILEVAGGTELVRLVLR
ncbi:MAG: SPOR domain-containing protein [Trueperaceae bacterium]|nr:SPOR domain-containing protein [Trueperaceae bacterium]